MHKEVQIRFPSISFPSTNPASHLTTAHYQNPKTDTGTIHRVYSDFTGYICTHLCICLCVALYNFVTCVAWSNHPSNQDTQLHYYHEFPQSPL